MASAAVSVQNVSKKFRLFGSPKERLMETFHPFNKKYHREFWALKDVSFDVEAGTTVGIVGRNGSGKSTLLQLITSILRPTSGTVTVNGRVSALLELGAGFSPEITGRENVLMHGVMMGLRRDEMIERLPAIEAFADIGEFIDQPVKTYSSGMFVRLAFAAAINVDPDILIVDEALAVGDAKFQHKCYGKFQEFQKTGKTILLVTHSTDVVVRHCDHALLLDGGNLIERGDPKTVTNCFLDIMFSGDLRRYSRTPVVVEQGYKGFDIVHYGKKFYAFSTGLGDIGAVGELALKIDEWLKDGACLVAASADEAKKLVDKTAVPSAQAATSIPAQDGSDRVKAEVDRFLKKATGSDNCQARRSYNKNEYRYGDRRAEILDYLIVAGKECDPPAITSGDVVDIYVKIKYNERMDAHITGFAIKTIDGVDVYGINTKNLNIALEPIERKPTIAVYKWSTALRLAAGDYFLDVGCGEYVNGEGLPLDRRYGLAHIMVRSDDACAGIVKLETRFERAC